MDGFRHPLTKNCHPYIINLLSIPPPPKKRSSTYLTTKRNYDILLSDANCFLLLCYLRLVVGMNIKTSSMSQNLWLQQFLQLLQLKESLLEGCFQLIALHLQAILKYTCISVTNKGHVSLTTKVHAGQLLYVVY